jgi:hypothetical protein
VLSEIFQTAINAFTLPDLRDYTKVRKVLKQMFRIILFPVVVFVWLVGWALYFVGIKTSDNNSRKSEVAKVENPLEIMTIINEELLIATEES